MYVHDNMPFPSQFPVGSHEPDLVLGESFVPGSDGNHFCQPTSIAVSEDTGIFFVGDGYCNSRILKFSRQGRLLKIISKLRLSLSYLKKELYITLATCL